MLEATSYLLKKDVYDLKSHNKCTKAYTENFEDAIKLKGGAPIFLDANVILRYYSISFTARKKLFDFLKKNKKRIYLTSQVQKEILRNREDTINKYFEQVSKQVPKEFDTNIVNKLDNFVGQHKTILKDYPYVEAGLLQHKQELEELLKKLNDDTEKKRKENKSLIWKDEFLKLLEEFNLLAPLDISIIDTLKKDFDKLRASVDVSKPESIFNKTSTVFPGLGDIKEKPDDPYGDYIIFHEIMNFQKESTSDTIFLTFDNTKGDWMSKGKSPYLHYVYNAFMNTERILYIVDAERTLESILDISVDSLINDFSKPEVNTVLDLQMLTEIFATHPLFQQVELVPADNRILNELNEANITSTAYIVKLLNVAKSNFHHVVAERKNLNSRGALRVVLKSLDLNYREKSLDFDGHHTRSNVKRYERYRNLFLGNS